MPSETLSLLQRGLATWSIDLTPDQEGQFEDYASLLVEWNTRVNLTRLVDPREIAALHFLDSLALFQVMAVPEEALVLDIGTGAGFPGLPIKIARPDIKLTLLEATAKKLAFCQAVVDALGLTDVGTVHARAEDWVKRPGETGYDKAYDVVVARAVAPMETLLGWAMPYVARNGVFVAWKGAKAAEEMAQAGETAKRLRVRMDLDQLPLPESGTPPIVHSYVLCRRAATRGRS